MTPIEPTLAPEFVQHLTACQSPLYAYIVTLMGRADAAHDVLQETNLKLCRRASDYDVEQPFLRWAYVFAKYEVMAWRRTQQRSRLVLDDELVELVANDYDQDLEIDLGEHQLSAMEQCLERLRKEQRDLIDARYSQGESIQVLSLRLGRSENVISAMLYRIRKSLHSCITEATLRKRTV